MDTPDLPEILEKMETSPELAQPPAVGYDESFLSPAATRMKIREELLPLAFENYRGALASPDAKRRDKAAKEVMDLAGINPKSSPPAAGATFNLPPAAIAKMFSGVVDLFQGQDVEYEVIDVTPEPDAPDTPGEEDEPARIQAVPRRDPQAARRVEEVAPPEEVALRVPQVPAAPSSDLFDPGDDTEGTWA